MPACAAARSSSLPSTRPPCWRTGGRWHHEFNAPLAVRDLVLDWLDGPARRTLVLVPLKCERWCRSDDDVARLVKAVADAYGHVLDPAARRELTSVHVCPVQTVGSLVFDRFETAQNTPVSRYRGRSIGGGYAPRWTAEPLRLLVAGLLDEHLRARSWWEKVLEVFGRDADLRQALAVLATQSYGPSQRVV